MAVTLTKRSKRKGGWTDGLHRLLRSNWFGWTILTCALLLAAGAAGIYLASSGGDSIRRSEYLEVDGARLYLLVRGADAGAPVLLWLHGGPGGAERPLFRYFNGRLEKYFVVVYWDQRGAGRSFDAKADPRHLTIAQQLADLDQLVNHLRLSLHREKIILIGHSWGAALGLLYTQAHPDKLSAFVAVNPLVSMQEQQRAEHDFVYRPPISFLWNGTKCRFVRSDIRQCDCVHDAAILTSTSLSFCSRWLMAQSPTI